MIDWMIDAWVRDFSWICPPLLSLSLSLSLFLSSSLSPSLHSIPFPLIVQVLHSLSQLPQLYAELEPVCVPAIQVYMYVWVWVWVCVCVCVCVCVNVCVHVCVRVCDRERERVFLMEPLRCPSIDLLWQVVDLRSGIMFIM
jgi:hypothetical protein